MALLVSQQVMWQQHDPVIYSIGTKTTYLRLITENNNGQLISRNFYTALISYSWPCAQEHRFKYVRVKRSCNRKPEKEKRMHACNVLTPHCTGE